MDEKESEKVMDPMTPQPQQHPEFVVREPDMIEICRVLSVKGNPQLARVFESVCRSRPAPSPDFAKVKLGDWIEGVGDITTEYERQFVMRYGEQTNKAVKEAASKAREKMMKLICEQCPVRNEEMPIEDYSAESCDGCLTRKVYESLRAGGER